MSFRALLLVSALLFAPAAWSQETAAPSFDLKSDTVRQIVRDAAATQYRIVEPIKEPKPARESPFARKDDPPLETSPLKVANRQKPPAPNLQPGPLGSLVDVLIESALGIQDDPAADQRAAFLTLCQSLDQPRSPTQKSTTCPSTGPN